MRSATVARRLAGLIGPRARAAESAAQQPSAIASLPAGGGGDLLFASGRLTWWQGFASLARPAATVNSAVDPSEHIQPVGTADAEGGEGAAGSQPAAVAGDRPQRRRGRPPRPKATANSAADVISGAEAAATGRPITAGSAVALAAGDSAAEPQAGAALQRKPRRRMGEHTIEWTPQLAAEARALWQQHGAISESQLRRVDKWTKSSQWFRNLPQLAAWLDHWQEAAAQLGRRRDMLYLVLADRSIIETGANPWRLLENLDAMQAAFRAHGVNPKNVHRNRMLQNRKATIVERIPLFLEAVERWPVKVDPALVLQRSPGLLAAHAANFEVYGLRIAEIKAWAPASLDLAKIVVGAPQLLDLTPALLRRRFDSLRAVAGLSAEQIATAVSFSPTLLARRAEAVAWKVAAHRTYAERRRAAGFGDELAEFLDPTAGGERGRPGQFPSRFCNLLVLSISVVQRLRFLLDHHAADEAVLCVPGYRWLRAPASSFVRKFPAFPAWLAAQPRDPTTVETKVAGSLGAVGDGSPAPQRPPLPRRGGAAMEAAAVEQ